MITTLYVMLLGGIAFLIAGTALSHSQIGKQWARGWPPFVFGMMLVGLGTLLTILPLNWALGL